MSLKSRIFLSIPLLFFTYIWLGMIFHIDVTPDWLFYDSFPHPEDPPSKGLLPDALGPVMFFFGGPIMFFIGSIYTVYKKLWCWFLAYIILGFGLWLSLHTDVF